LDFLSYSLNLQFHFFRDFLSCLKYIVLEEITQLITALLLLWELENNNGVGIDGD